MTADWQHSPPVYRVAHVVAAPATGGDMRIAEIYEPPINDYVAAWRTAGTWRKKYQDKLFVVVECAK